jgi:hypothetical protein
MEEDLTARSSHHLGDPAAHLAGSDDENTLPLHGRGHYWNPGVVDGVLRVMFRSLALTGAAWLTLAACGGTDEAATPPPAPAKQTGGDPVLAAWSTPNGSEIFWADDRTLEPVNGRSYPVPFFSGAAELSPDEAMLAIGGSETPVVDVVDLEKMRSLGEIALAPGTTVDRLHWAEPDRILATLWGEQSKVTALQPGARKPIDTHDLDGMILKSSPAGNELAILLAPADGIGPARLALFDGDEVRYADLPGVRAGWEESGNKEDYRARQLLPALAVDPSGSRAVVIAPGNRAVEVDLATLEATSHDLAQPASLLERFRNWLEPGAWAKMIDGPELNAVWLPSGLIALSGVTYSTEGDSVHATPAGLALVDPGDWSVRHVSDAPAWVALHEDALLGSSWNEEGASQALHVYGADGAERFALERRGQADLSQTAGGLLYVSTQDGRKVEIVDLATGKTVGRAAPKRPAYLVFTD